MSSGFNAVSFPVYNFHLVNSGMYFALLLYSDDGRVLTNGSGSLPIVLVDENFSAGDLASNFHWAQKARDYSSDCCIF